MASPILPPDFLLGPAPNLTKNNVDFKKTELPEYHGLYATVLDGCLTKEECDLLVRAAEATAKGVWEPAMVNVGGGQQKMIRESRDCGRILWDDRDMVERIWNRVKPVMGEIMEVGQIPRVSGRYGFKSSQVWEMTRLNERMRFLKYGRGQYFRPHCDGAYATENNEEVSFYTLHLYLNESQPDVPDGKLEGGATTFHPPYEMDRSFDVVPKVGRVLIFQHRDLVHSGAEVQGGTKLTLRTDLMYKRRG